MKPIILVPLVALVLVGGSAGAYLAVTGGGSVEEATVAQPTATPSPAPAAKSQETPSTLAAPAEESQLAPPPAQTPAVPDDSLIYHDAKFGFSVDHPVDFIVEDLGAKGALPLGVLKLVRIVEDRFTDGFPPGDVSVAVLVKDAETLEEWLSKHTRTTHLAPAGEPISFFGVANVTATTVAGRDALSFDWETSVTTIHGVVFLFQSFVFHVSWFAADPAYEPTIQPVFDETLRSFTGQR